MTDDSELRRRQFLLSTGALGTTALAGCASSGGSSSDGFVFRTLDDAYTLEGERKVILAESSQQNLDLEPRQQIRLGKGRMTLDGEPSDEEGESGSSGEVRPQNPLVFTLRETRPVELAAGDVAISEESLTTIGAEEGESVSFVNYAPNPDLTSRSGAEQNNDYIETTIEGSDTVCFLAPHGGQVYPYTAQQANRAASSMGESSWTTLAFEEDEETLRNRWYVPATEIHPASYPKLEAMDENYEYTVSFSGFDGEPNRATSGDGVAVGGLVTEDDLGIIRDAIQSSLNEANAEDTTVWLYPTGAPENPPSEHIANWMTSSSRNGIEITATDGAREQHWNDIADGVVQGLTTILEEEDN